MKSIFNIFCNLIFAIIANMMSEKRPAQDRSGVMFTRLTEKKRTAETLFLRLKRAIFFQNNLLQLNYLCGHSPYRGN